MRKIILNDGTEIAGRVGYAEGCLWCFFSGYTMQEVSAMFLDEEKTKKIIFWYGGQQDEFDGFTNCIAMTVDVDGVYSVCLKN